MNKVNYRRGYRGTMIEVIAPANNDRRYYSEREWVYRVTKNGRVRHEGPAYGKAEAIKAAKAIVNYILDNAPKAKYTVR